MVWQDRKQSIFNTFNGYQGGNRLITCNPEKHQGNYTIPTPTFSLFMTKDPVADWAYFAGMLGSANYLPNHYNAVSIPSFPVISVFVFTGCGLSY